VPGFAENRVPFVSREDVAAACAVALSTDGQVGATYNLCGQDRITGAERAALLRRSTGKAITSQALTQDQLGGTMGEAELPPFVVDAVASMQAARPMAPMTSSAATWSGCRDRRRARCRRSSRRRSER